MKPQSIFKWFFVVILLLIYNCSSVDSDDDNGDLYDLTISVDEYPSSGTFLSEIPNSLSGTVNYNIISQTVSQALIITNDQLAVGDWLAFDYETYTDFEAEIEASNDSETELITVKININDVDDIWAFLNGASKTSYENANSGEWVMITQSEYNDLANYLAETTKSGATDNQIYNGSSVSNYSGDRTIANNNGTSIPSGSYVFAFKYYSWINNVVSNKVKISQDDAGGAYQDLGSILPEHDDEFNHFVLKGASVQTNSEAFIGMYTSGAIGIKSDASSSYKWRNGDVENLDNTASGNVFLHQGLSTTLKQWN